MSKNKDKTLDSSSSKALLYSELLNTSVTDHVHELLQKKQKSSTFHVQKSSVLGRASKLLQSLKDTENDVKNIEEVEEGEPVIDMSVTLIDRVDESGSESDSDSRIGALETETKVRKLIECSDSDNMSENETKEMIDDKHMWISSDSSSELSENESNDYVLGNKFLCSDLDIKVYKGENTIISDINAVTSSDSVDNMQEPKLLASNFDAEQFENKKSKVVLENQNNKFQDSDDKLSNQEKYLEFPKLDVGLTTSVPPDSECKYQSYLNSTDFCEEKKRKLISVIDEVDEQNMCVSTKQKRVV